MMAKMNVGFFRFAFVNCQCQRADRAAQATSMVATVRKNVFLAKMADNLMPLVASYPFRSAVPKHNSAAPVEQIHANLQAVENRTKNIGITGSGIDIRVRRKHTCTSAKIPDT
jgi:hypothetical protein